MNPVIHRETTQPLPVSIYGHWLCTTKMQTGNNAKANIPFQSTSKKWIGSMSNWFGLVFSFAVWTQSIRIECGFDAHSMANVDRPIKTRFSYPSTKFKIFTEALCSILFQVLLTTLHNDECSLQYDFLMEVWDRRKNLCAGMHYFLQWLTLYCCCNWYYLALLIEELVVIRD